MEISVEEKNGTCLGDVGTVDKNLNMNETGDNLTMSHHQEHLPSHSECKGEQTVTEIYNNEPKLESIDKCTDVASANKSQDDDVLKASMCNVDNIQEINDSTAPVILETKDELSDNLLPLNENVNKEHSGELQRGNTNFSISDSAAAVQDTKDETSVNSEKINVSKSDSVDGKSLYSGDQFTDRRVKESTNDLTSDSDSDSSSDSSSSDSSSDETEDEKMQNANIVINIEDDDSEKGKKLNKNGLEDIRTKGEVFPEELPPVENLKVSISDDIVLRQIGNISSIVGVLVIIQSNKGEPPLNEQTFLFDGRFALGQIFEVFGPVSTPWYSVRFNSPKEITDHELKVGSPIYFAPSDSNCTNYVFVEDLKRMKGSDASWENNNEPPPKHIDYSDDEEEKRAKAKKRHQRQDDTTAEKEEDGSQLPGARPVHKYRQKNNRQKERTAEAMTRHPNKEQRTGQWPAKPSVYNSNGSESQGSGHHNMPRFQGNHRPMRPGYYNQNFEQQQWRNNCPGQSQNFNQRMRPLQFQGQRPRIQNNNDVPYGNPPPPWNPSPFQSSHLARPPNFCQTPSFNGGPHRFKNHNNLPFGNNIRCENNINNSNNYPFQCNRSELNHTPYPQNRPVQTGYVHAPPPVIQPGCVRAPPPPLPNVPVFESNQLYATENNGMPSHHTSIVDKRLIYNQDSLANSNPSFSTNFGPQGMN